MKSYGFWQFVILDCYRSQMSLYAAFACIYTCCQFHRNKRSGYFLCLGKNTNRKGEGGHHWSEPPLTCQGSGKTASYSSARCSWQQWENRFWGTEGRSEQVSNTGPARSLPHSVPRNLPSSGRLWWGGSHREQQLSPGFPLQTNKAGLWIRSQSTGQTLKPMQYSKPHFSIIDTCCVFWRERQLWRSVLPEPTCDMCAF